MEIFYADITNHINGTDNIEMKNLQHKFGNFLVKKIAREVYNLDNTEITIKNKKPHFVHSDLQFSISHCENIILTAFDANPVGIDIEKIKPRNFEKLAKRYNLKNCKPETFYTFWTKYEAETKLQVQAKNIITKKFANDFILTVAGNFSDNIKVIKTEL